MITYEKAMEALETQREILVQADNLFLEYMETRKYDKMWYSEAYDYHDDFNFSANFYDSETVYFGYAGVVDEECFTMPLAFVYSEEYRKQMAEEGARKLAKRLEQEKARKEKKESAEYKKKEALFEQLKKELGK